MEASILILAAALVVAVFILRRRPTVAPQQDGAELGRLLAAEHEATRSVQARVEQSLAALQDMGAVMRERKQTEEQTAAAVREMGRLVAGSYSKGRVGENLLEAALNALPPEMVCRDLRIAGRVCEFALRMEDGQMLPIDSKWPAAELVAEMEGTTDLNQRESLRRRIEAEVGKKVRDVAGYIDPSITVPMAVVALPDQVYACCRKVHGQAKAQRVVLVAYSNAVPFVLSFSLMHRAYAGGIDERLVADGVDALSTLIEQMEDKIESHMSRGLKQAANASDDLRTLIAKARAAVVGMKAPTQDLAGGGRRADVQELRDVDRRAEAV